MLHVHKADGVLGMGRQRTTRRTSVVCLSSVFSKMHERVQAVSMGRFPGQCN